MKGKIFKLFRCPENKCGANHRIEEPLNDVPPCPRCGSKRANYSDNWHISYRLPNGKPKLESVSPFREYAVKKLQKVEREIEEGIFEPYKAPLPWSKAKELFLAYIEDHAKRKGTKDFYNSQIRAIDRYITQFAPTMDKIDSDTLVSIQNFRKGHVSPNTINKEITTLLYVRSALSTKILREVDGKKIPWLENKPLVGFYEKLEEIPPPEVYVEPDEIALLLGATNDTFMHCYILLACMAGLRRRTIREFRREWINWKANRLEIPPAGRKRGKGKIHYVSIADEVKLVLAKVWAGYRPYINEDTSPKFIKSLEGGKPSKHTFYSDHPRTEPYTEGFLFCHPDDPERMWTGFGIDYQALKKKVGIKKRFHDLKHTAGTLYQWAIGDIKATTDFLDESSHWMAARYIRDSNVIRDSNMQKFQAMFKLHTEEPLQIPEIISPSSKGD